MWICIRDSKNSSCPARVRQYRSKPMMMADDEEEDVVLNHEQDVFEQQHGHNHDGEDGIKEKLICYRFIFIELKLY